MKKMLDEKEKFREYLNIQFVKLKKVAAVGSLLLLALNLSFAIYPYISYRWLFSNIYIGVFLLFISIILIMLFLAHIYVVKLEMYRTETKADYIFNPYATYGLTAKDVIFLEDIYLPILKGDDMSIKERKEKIMKVESWVKYGYIPKDHFSDNWKEWYITKKERRL
jgi:hypothetical protein